MPSPYRHGNLFWLRVRRSDRRQVKCSTGTSDRRTAVAIGHMVDDLGDRGEQDVLDAVTDRQLALLDVWAAYRTDRTVDSIKVTLDDVDLDPLVAEWSRALKAGGLASTEKYTAQVRRLIPEGKRFPRSQFRRKTISEHLAALTLKAKQLDGTVLETPATGSTRNRHRAALRQFGRWLVEREVIEFNPVSDVRSAPENPARTVHYSPAELKALIDALDGPYQALEAIMACTGMEWGAIVRTVNPSTGKEKTPGLRRRDVDVEAKTIHAKGGKNAWRNRTCTVTEMAFWPIVEAYVKGFTPNALLFDGIREEIALRHHHAAREAAKLPHSTLHDHRHSYAVNAIRRGMPDHLVAAQLGHRDSTLVQRVYGKFAPQQKDFAQYVSGTAEREADATRVAVVRDSAPKSATRLRKSL
jgi:integrase